MEDPIFEDIDRMISWLHQLRMLPEGIPYWTNNVFANDCQDARAVLQELESKFSKPRHSAAD